MSDFDPNQNTEQQESQPYTPASFEKRTAAWMGIAYMLLIMFAVTVSIFTGGKTLPGTFPLFLVPVAVALGTLSFTALSGLFLPLGVKDSIASTAGFGWDSLAPTLLQSYSLQVSAVAFLSNVMREIFAIIFIPLVARKVGYVECTALAGAAAMDSLLPVVVGATHERITIYSFVTGVILSLAVPIIIPLIVALPL